MRIRPKITILLLLLTLIPLFFGGILLYSHNRKALLQETLGGLEALATAKELLIETMLETQQERLQLIARRTRLRQRFAEYLLTERNPLTAEEIRAILRDALSSTKDARILSILDLQGNVLISTAPDLEGTRMSPGSGFRRGAARFHLSLNAHDDGRDIHLYGPLTHQDELLGILQMETGSELFDRVTRSYDGLGTSGDISLGQWNDQGEAVLLVPRRFEGNAVAGDAIPQSEQAVPIIQALRRQNGLLRQTRDYRGKPVFAVTRYIEGVDWGLVVKKDIREVMSSVNEIGRMQMLIFLLVALLMVLASIRIARMITKPIADLDQGVRRIRKGEWNYRVPSGADNEIGQLACEFNHMAEALQKSTTDLEAREMQNRSILDSALDGIIVMDHRGCIIEFNRAAERMFGYEQDEIVGERLSEKIIPEEFREAHEQGMEIYLKTGHGPVLGKRMELTAMRKNGVRFPVEVTIVRVKGSEPAIFTGFIRDITEQRRSRERLKESYEILEVVNRVGQTLSAELNLHKLLQAVTDAATKLCGAQYGAFFENVRSDGGESYHVHTLSGVHAQKFKHFPSPRNTALFDPTFRGEKIVRLHDVTRDPRFGKNLPYKGMPAGHMPIKSYLAVPVISRAGKVLGGLFFGHPEAGVFKSSHERMVAGLAAQAAIAIENAQMVEELKTAHHQLQMMNETLEHRVQDRTALAERRAVKLRELASALTFAEQKERRRLAQILHDHLQQILIAAKLSIGRLQSKVQDQKIKSAVDQAEELINESISASRSFTVELSPPVLHDAGFGAAMEWLSRWMKEKHGMRVIIDADEELEIHSEEISVFLFQAVRELLFNVVKHAAVDEASVEVVSQQRHVRIVVRDQGKGFDPDALSRESSQGFGLFNIRERLEMLGGKMHMESAVGKGTRFILIAPLLETTLPKVGRAHLSPRLQGRVLTNSKDGIRVMVVDDHKILRQGVINLLESSPDIQVIAEAADGQEALEKALDLVPEVIIMDITMPRMNGVEATAKIKEQLPDVKIIGLSLHESEDMSETMRKAGAVAYLTKGGPVDVLVATIRQVADHSIHKGT